MLPLSLSLFLLLPAISSAVEPLHFTLTRRSRPHDMDYYISVSKHLHDKYHGKKTPSRRADSVGFNIVNQQLDASYFGTVNIGTPPQPFNVILDTGSADLWVADSTCQGCTRATPVFQGSKSTSLKLSTSGTKIQYGSGEVSGQIGTDVVNMGPFTIPQQTLLFVDNISSGLLDGSVSGILGLGFTALAQTQATPFWETLANNGQLTAPEMSFWMTRFRNVPNAQVEEPGGVFTLGGTNSSLFVGDIEFLDMPVQNPSFWLLSLKTVTVQGKSVPITSGNSAISAIDTGTTLIGGPSNDVKAIWAAVPGSQPVPSMQGFFSFPCTTDVAITLSFGGKTWPINTADMSLGPITPRSNQCVGGIFDLSLGSNIVSGGGNPNWVVGATFLKNVYSVYRADPPSIGFAQLSDAAGGSGAPGAGPSTTSSDGSGGGGKANQGSSNKAATGAVLISAVAGLLAAICLL